MASLGAALDTAPIFPNVPNLFPHPPTHPLHSAAETEAVVHTNDTATAADMDTFLRRWFRAFPEFQVPLQGAGWGRLGACALAVAGQAGLAGLAAGLASVPGMPA